VVVQRRDNVKYDQANQQIGRIDVQVLEEIGDGHPSGELNTTNGNGLVARTTGPLPGKP
jgi:hypothetical protein